MPASSSFRPLAAAVLPGEGGRSLVQAGQQLSPGPLERRHVGPVIQPVLADSRGRGADLAGQPPDGDPQVPERRGHIPDLVPPGVADVEVQVTAGQGARARGHFAERPGDGPAQRERERGHQHQHSQGQRRVADPAALRRRQVAGRGAGQAAGRAPFQPEQPVDPDAGRGQPGRHRRVHRIRAGHEPGSDPLHRDPGRREQHALQACRQATGRGAAERAQLRALQGRPLGGREQLGMPGRGQHRGHVGPFPLRGLDRLHDGQVRVRGLARVLGRRAFQEVTGRGEQVGDDDVVIHGELRGAERAGHGLLPERAELPGRRAEPARQVHHPGVRAGLPASLVQCLVHAALRRGQPGLVRRGGLQPEQHRRGAFRGEPLRDIGHGEGLPRRSLELLQVSRGVPVIHGGNCHEPDQHADGQQDQQHELGADPQPGQQRRPLAGWWRGRWHRAQGSDGW